MRFAFQPAFLASTKRLSAAEAARLLRAVEKFQTRVEQGQWSQGLGITHLHGEYYEFRVDIHNRVIFKRSGDLIQYLLYGSHDEVRRFLRQA